MAAVGNQVSRAMILHEVTFRDLWETIMVIEPAAAALAARRATIAFLSFKAAGTRDIVGDAIQILRGATRLTTSRFPNSRRRTPVRRRC